MYLIKAVHKTTGSVTYHLQGHSKMTDKAKKVSKYYVWDKVRGATITMKKLSESREGADYTWSVVTTEDECIEVV